ncbi:MAG: peptide deformylase [Pseudomonadota bacterium]
MSDFLLWPDKRLKMRAEPVAAVNADIVALWDRMLSAMYAMPGVGLAAPQIGVMLRVAVLDCAEKGVKAPVRLANPELLETSNDTNDHEEASPNLPGVHAKVTRPTQAKVRFLDATGAVVERWFEGLWATSVQHQIDHLDGKLYIDRLSPMKRRMVLDRFKKLQRRG